MDLELRGKKVLITGASKGIGLACAHGFAAEGARVHIASRSEADLKAASDAIARQHTAEVSIHPFDLGVTQNTAALGKACGDVDVLVNNAGSQSKENGVRPTHARPASLRESQDRKLCRRAPGSAS